MLSGSGLTTAEICGQLGVGRSTLYRHLHASSWERDAPGRTTASEAMMKALEDDMEARPGVYRRLAAS